MGRLTIQEIAKVLVTKNGLGQSQANRFATELFTVIQERLEKNELVKVKGLGTWKVITVDARESVSVRTGDRVMIEEHSKITFTPDATMRELVNKPFSQFETVVLNDNVEFEDLKEQPVDSEFEEEPLVEQKEPVTVQEEPLITQEEPLITQEEPHVEQEQSDTTPPIAPLIEIPEESPEEEPEPVIDKAPEEITEEAPEEITEKAPEETVVQQSKPIIYDDDDIIGTSVDDEDDYEEEKIFSIYKWVWIIFGALCVLGLAASGGYYYGCQRTALAALSDTVFIRDTVYVTEIQDTATVKVVEEPTFVEETKAETAKSDEVKVEKPKAETPKIETPKAEPAPEVDKYSEKDERVRLGAYRIVGLDHEVKVLPGQTFYSICRAHLGPDMECYIEVYNNLPRNPQIQAGQVIKIPKLQLKKRKKQ